MVLPDLVCSEPSSINSNRDNIRNPAADLHQYQAVVDIRVVLVISRSRLDKGNVKTVNCQGAAVLKTSAATPFLVL